jgi:AcrR family transcriptional regulator
MPRLIDTERRRRDIAAATWRLARRDGLDAVSVRNVAKEAGLSAGSLRHVFSTQADLLTFAMAALAERVTERQRALEPADTPLEAAADMLAQLLPLDDERQREAEVWFAFVVRARVDPQLRALGERIDAGLRELVRDALIAQGREPDDQTIQEALAGMGQTG